MKTGLKIAIGAGIGIGTGVLIYRGFFRKDAAGKTWAQNQGWMNASGSSSATRANSGPAGKVKRMTLDGINYHWNGGSWQRD